MSREERITKEAAAAMAEFRQRMKTRQAEAVKDRAAIPQETRNREAIDKMHKHAMDIAQKNGNEVSSERVRKEITEIAYKSDRKK